MEKSTLRDWAEIASGSRLQPEAYTQYVFPGISFNCNGNVTTVTVAAKRFAATSSSEHPAVGIYRKTSPTSYSRKAFIVTLKEQQISDSRFEIALDPPIAFQTGDVLGIYQPPNSSLQIDIRRVNSSGREYRYANPMEHVPGGLLQATSRFSGNDLLPLVNAEIISGKRPIRKCHTVKPCLLMSYYRKSPQISPPFLSSSSRFKRGVGLFAGTCANTP